MSFLRKLWAQLRHDANEPAVKAIERQVVMQAARQIERRALEQIAVAASRQAEDGQLMPVHVAASAGTSPLLIDAALALAEKRLRENSK